MSELLNIQDVSVIGCCLIAIIWLVKKNDKYMNIQNEERKQDKEERKQERKEWLKALGDNTEQLKNVACKLESIPFMQKDIDNIKDDMREIKEKIKYKGRNNE